jgi:hypothetical protein
VALLAKNARYGQERKKVTQKRGLRDRLNPTLVPAIRVPRPREQTYTTETRESMGIRRERGTSAGMEVGGEVFEASSMRDDVTNVLHRMDVKAVQE